MPVAGHILHPLTGDKPDTLQALYQKTLVNASECLRDLRFVSHISMLVTVLRRPMAMGPCIVMATSNGDEAVYCAATYLNAGVAPLWADDSLGTKVGSKRMLLQQLLRAAATVTTMHMPVILVATSELLRDPDQLCLLQHFLETRSLNGLTCASELLHAFADDTQQLVDAVEALGHTTELQEVCAHPDSTADHASAAITMRDCSMLQALPQAQLPKPQPQPGRDKSQVKPYFTNSTRRRGEATAPTWADTFPQVTAETKPANADKHFMQCLNGKLQEVANHLRICLVLSPAQQSHAKATWYET